MAALRPGDHPALCAVVLRLLPQLQSGRIVDPRTRAETIKGYEVMHMMRQRQVVGVAKEDVLAQLNFMAQIFGVVA